MIAVLLITLLITIISNVPIAICLGLSSASALWVGTSTPLTLLAQRLFTSVDVTTLLAIPLFILAGKIMEKGGISQRLVDLSYELVGWLPGSLAMVTVLSCMFFAALSGSAPATVAAIGGIMVPVMVRDGYPRGFSGAIAAAGGCIGVIIPPSIPFVNYAVITNVSVGKMFIAGFLPGILMGVAMMVYCYYAARKYKFGLDPKPFNVKHCLVALHRAFWAILMPFIILGGIYSGVFTPTEAAAVACVYGLIVGLFIYRGIKIKDLPEYAHAAAMTSGMIFFIIGGANITSWLLSTQGIPALISGLVLGLTQNKYLILLLINVILLINGCFLDLTASLYIYTPIFYPIAMALGIDPIHLGMILVINMDLGLLTPPLGMNLFVAKSLDQRMDFNAIVKAIVPIFAIEAGILLLITYIPQLTLCFIS